MQPQIRNLIAYLLPLPDKKPRTAVVKRDKTSGLDRNDRQKYSRLQHTLLIRKGSLTNCLLLLCARLKISCISGLCCVWNNVCVHVCKTSNWWFIIICNCIYIVVINCGWRMDGAMDGAWDGEWRRWLSSSDVTFLQKSQGLVKKHGYFMHSVWALLWIDCFETYMVVT